MDWANIGTQIILGIVGVLITGIGAIITRLINKYVKDEKLKKIISSLNEVVQQCVQYTYQTYVKELKDGNMFTKEVQEEALNKCLEKIKQTLPNDVSTWLSENYTDIDSYLKTLIESAVAVFNKK